MQLPGKREALHLSLGQDHEKHDLFKGEHLNVMGKLTKAIMWQQSCHLHAIAGQSQWRQSPVFERPPFVLQPM